MCNRNNNLRADLLTRHIPQSSEIQTICEVFLLDKLVNVDGELGGLFNVNLKITTTLGEFVIRVHSRLSTETHLNAERTLITKLKEKGIPVLAPLRNASGETFATLHNQFVQVAPFVQDVPFVFTNEQAYHCGNILRKFHDALINETDIPNPLWSNYPAKEVLSEGIARLKEQQANLHEIH